MKKKTFIIIASCTLSGFMVLYLLSKFLQPSYEFSDLFGEQVDSITEINIAEGVHGKLYSVTDSEKIECIISSLSSLKYRRNKLFIKPDSCKYTMCFVTKDSSNTIWLYSDSLCSVGDSDYTINSNITSAIANILLDEPFHKD